VLNNLCGLLIFQQNPAVILSFALAAPLAHSVRSIEGVSRARCRSSIRLMSDVFEAFGSNTLNDNGQKCSENQQKKSNRALRIHMFYTL